MLNYNVNIFKEFFVIKNLIYFLMFNILFYICKFMLQFNIIELIGLLLLSFFVFNPKNVIFDIYMFFLYGFCVLGSNFGKINVVIASMPLYSLEILFVVFFSIYLVWCLLSSKIYIIYLDNPIDKIFFVWISIGLLSFIRGLFLYSDFVFVLRESSVWLYSLLIIITPMIIDNSDRLYKFFMIVVFGIFVHIIQSILHINSSYLYFYAGITFIIFYVLFFSTKINIFVSFLNFLLIYILLYFLFIDSMVRAVWIGIAFSLLFYFIFLKKYLLFSNIKFVLFVLIVLFLSVLFVQSKYFSNIYGEFISIFLIEESTNDNSVNNANWRLDVWKDYIKEGSKNFMIGSGCGRKFIPPTLKIKGYGGDWNKDGWQDAHNAYISLFFRAGFIGVVSFFLLVFMSLMRAFSLVKKALDYRIRILASISVMIVIYILASTFFMPMLFVPYMSIFLWIFLGIIFALNNFSNEQKNCNT